MIAEKNLEEQLAGLPVNVVKWEIEKGPDSTNEPSVSVWITLAEWPEFATRQQARDVIRDFIRDAEGVDYVYVYFQTADEIAALAVR